MRGAVPLVALALVAAGCGSSESDESRHGHGPAPRAGHPANDTLGPDQRCPGDPDCQPTDDPALYVGVGTEEITPTVDHVVAFAPREMDDGRFKDFNPLMGDVCVPKGACDPIADFPTCAAMAVDPMKCTWIAGFGVGRGATGVADPNWVRCVVLQQGATKVGLCSVDNVGWFYNETQRTRDLLEKTHPEIELDLLLVASTHVHETQDTMGIWGPTDGESGVKRDYNRMVREKTVAALVTADGSLQRATTQLGATTVDGHISETDPAGNRTAAFVTDVRDPVAFDNELRTIRFVAAAGGDTIATLINWTAHPEYAGDENTLTSSDYAHTLREGVEKGLDIRAPDDGSIYRAEGVGGVALFFNGALGGQVGPGEVIHVDWQGNPTPEGLDRARRNGEFLAAYALESLREGSTTVEIADLGFRAREIYLDVVNGAFHIAIAQQLFDRDGELYDPSKPLGEDNVPALRSQIAVVDIGPAELVTIPGELHGELLLATPDGVTAVDPPFPFTPPPFSVTNDHERNPDCASQEYSRCNDLPPDIESMDRGKVIDLARDPRAKFRWALGLTPDEVGYIVPEYDYLLDEQNPYFEEAPGEHYEETNSVGTTVQRDYVDAIQQLLRTKPVVRR